MRMHRDQRLPQLILGSDVTGECLGRADDRNRLAFEIGFEDRAREAIQRVLKHPGNTMVVLRRRDEDAVTFSDPALERCPLRGLPDRYRDLRCRTGCLQE
jgi:hypothetical protein